MKKVEYQRPPVRVALMGVGRAMLEGHYPIYRAHPTLFRVVAACDIIKDRRDIVARDFPHCRMFRQFADMLDERDIDLVDIATCTRDHVKHALLSLKRGFWTLLETPMALTVEDAQVLRGQALKSMNRLLILQRGMFSPDFLLARQMMSDERLGRIYEIRIAREDFIRRNDWQCVKILGGGASYYAMPDLVVQALRLLPSPPVQMWSDLQRLASVGDAEDYVRLCLRTRSGVSAQVEFNGGCLPEARSPAFEIRGERGVFRVSPGASEGELVCIDPAFSFPRRRSSVRTPPLDDMHEKVPTVRTAVRLADGVPHGPSVFWKCVYDSVRTAAAFPIQLDESIEAVRFTHLMKKTSPFAK